MGEWKGNRNAEYLRVSKALVGLKTLKIYLEDDYPKSASLLDQAIEYLEERQVKLGPRS